MSVFFLTTNDYKFEEYKRIGSKEGLTLERWSHHIQEIQEIDFRAMARAKVLDAYERLLHPVVVDVSGIRLGA